MLRERLRVQSGQQTGSLIICPLLQVHTLELDNLDGTMRLDSGIPRLTTADIDKLSVSQLDETERLQDAHNESEQSNTRTHLPCMLISLFFVQGPGNTRVVPQLPGLRATAVLGPQDGPAEHKHRGDSKPLHGKILPLDVHKRHLQQHEGLLLPSEQGVSQSAEAAIRRGKL